jgi:hypothetical protein
MEMKRRVTVNEIIILQQREMALEEFSAEKFTETRSGEKSSSLFLYYTGSQSCRSCVCYTYVGNVSL